MSADRLLDPGERRRTRFDPRKPHALVPLGDVCPECSGPVSAHSYAVDALFVHGGHGATRRTTYRWCPSCALDLGLLVAEERPPRRAAA